MNWLQLDHRNSDIDILYSDMTNFSGSNFGKVLFIILATVFAAGWRK